MLWLVKGKSITTITTIATLPSTTVGLVGCTQTTLSLAPTVSVKESQTGEWSHTATKLQTLQCERKRQEEQLNRG